MLDRASRTRGSASDLSENQQGDRMAHQLCFQRTQGEVELARRTSATSTACGPCLDVTAHEPCANAATIRTILDHYLERCRACTRAASSCEQTSPSGHGEPNVCQCRFHHAITPISERVCGTQPRHQPVCIVLSSLVHDSSCKKPSGHLLPWHGLHIEPNFVVL